MTQCNLAYSDATHKKWIQGLHDEGRTCTLDVPICNSNPIFAKTNAPLFKEYRGGSDQNTIDVGLAQISGISGMEKSLCHMLDACDTFIEDRSYARLLENGKACYKATSTSSFPFVDEFTTTVCSTNRNNLLLYSSFESCIPQVLCNGFDDDGNPKYIGPFGEMMDCYLVESLIDNNFPITYQKRGSWGMAWYSDGYFAWRPACTERSMMISKLTRTPFGQSCLEIESTRLCDSMGTFYQQYNSAWIYSKIQIGNSENSACFAAPDCNQNTWIHGSRYMMHVTALAKYPFEAGFSFSNWGTYQERYDKQRWITMGCKIVLSDFVAYKPYSDVFDSTRLIEIGAI